MGGGDDAETDRVSYTQRKVILWSQIYSEIITSMEEFEGYAVLET